MSTCNCCKVYPSKYQYSYGICRHCKPNHQQRDLGQYRGAYPDKYIDLLQANPGMIPCECCGLHYWAKNLITLTYTPCEDEFSYCTNCARKHRKCFNDGNAADQRSKRKIKDDY